MTPLELKARYNELYEKMKHSKDVSNMHIFGDAFTRTFEKLADMHPDMAEAIINLLSAVEFRNFVTAEEAMAVAMRFINADKSITGATEDSKGAHWKMEEMKAFLQSRNLPPENKPYYNWPALWLTVNMEYSDYADTLVDVLGTKDGEKIATTCYKLALRKLADPDRPHFIRPYFNLNSD